MSAKNTKTTSEGTEAPNRTDPAFDWAAADSKHYTDSARTKAFLMHVIKLVIVVLVGVAVAAPGITAQDIPGTYRLAICSVPCEDTDATQVVARGTIVLFASTAAVDAIQDSVRARLRRECVWFVYDRSPNACFSIPEHEAEVDGRELYAGIIESGLTAWTVQDGG